MNFFKPSSLEPDEIRNLQVGDVLQFTGGKAYEVTSVQNDIALKPYRSWHPVSLPKDDRFKGKVWSTIAELAHDLIDDQASIRSIERKGLREE